MFKDLTMANKEIIKLYRSEEVDILYQKRKIDLENMWKKDHPRIEFKHLFQDINWLSSNGVCILNTNFTPESYCIVNDFLYEDIKIHYTFLPRKNNNVSIGQMFIDIYLWISRNQYTNYAIVKKSEGSIDFPHWHLLIY